jgi:hypothetical protein
VKAPRIHTCPEWDARPPRQEITLTRSRATRVIWHHTAGHGLDFGSAPTHNVPEAYAYARAIQNFHMDDRDRRWIDSGHNFLITRTGVIVQGRWFTVSAIQAGRMVVSAHCPGQNTNIGIEIEHKGTEKMTVAQREQAARLVAWFSDRYKLKTILPVEPHSKYVATNCPVNLVSEIPAVRARALKILRGV